MKPKTLILMLVAVACGLVAAYLAKTMQTPQAAPVSTVKMFVAKVPLPIGTKITAPMENQLIAKDFNPDSVPPKAVPGTLEDFKAKLQDKVLGRSLEAGEAVTESTLGRAKDLISEALAKKGYLAYAMEVNRVTAVNGFVQAGDFIDLAVTQPETNPRFQMAQTFLKNVLVVAADRNTTNTPTDAKAETAAPVPSMFILAVTQKQANLISLKKRKGEMIVTLRNRFNTGKDEESDTVSESDPDKGDPTPGKDNKPQTIRVWVAKKTVLPPRVFTQEEFNEVFELRPVPPEMAGRAFKLEQQIPANRELKQVVMADCPLLEGHFTLLTNEKEGPLPKQELWVRVYSSTPGERKTWWVNTATREVREVNPEGKTPPASGSGKEPGATSSKDQGSEGEAK